MKTDLNAFVSRSWIHALAFCIDGVWDLLWRFACQHNGDPVVIWMSDVKWIKCHLSKTTLEVQLCSFNGKLWLLYYSLFLSLWLCVCVCVCVCVCIVEKSECVCARVCAVTHQLKLTMSQWFVFLCAPCCLFFCRAGCFNRWSFSWSLCTWPLQMSCIRISALLCSVTQPLNTRLKTTVKYLSPLTNVLFSKETFFYVWPQMSKHEKRSIIPLSLLSWTHQLLMVKV